MKATEQYFPVGLFIMLYKVVLSFEFENQIQWCDHSKESYWAVLFCGTVYYAVQGGSNFWVWESNPLVWPFKWKLLNSTFTKFYQISCFFLHLLGYLNLTPFLKNGYSCALLNRPFQSCPMPLFQSDAKCEAIPIYSPAKKDSFCLALKVRLFETRKWPI